jgi:hypothetical protein
LELKRSVIAERIKELTKEVLCGTTVTVLIDDMVSDYEKEISSLQKEIVKLQKKVSHEIHHTI